MSRYTISIEEPVPGSGIVVVESQTEDRAIAVAKEKLSRAIDQLEGSTVSDGNDA
jgi:hypothetical protein